MAVKLRYTRRAAVELDEILSFIDERSPQGARSVKARIQAMATLLLQHPQAGHLTSKSGLRRMVVYPYPYLIFYRVTGTRSSFTAYATAPAAPPIPKAEE